MATGEGDVYASSCQSALWKWKRSSQEYAQSHLVDSVYTTPSYVVEGPLVSATDVITLCDGYKRAVGSASYVSSTSQTVGNQTITAKVLGPYPTAMPCSIGISDCINLYSSYSQAASSLLGVNTTVSAPPCATNGSNSIPFHTTSCSYGNIVGVRGSSVQLLYWPVRTVSDSDYLCKSFSYSDRHQSPMTLAGTPTGSGPNTFVTSGLTITSPTIALSYSGLSRIDGCGTTIDHTIITLKPEELSSVRGARSLFDLYPFNFGDLNWMCQEKSGNNSYTTQDVEVEGQNCYQNVPANAYWSAAQVFDRAFYANTSQVKQWTMINNYQPYVLPAQSVWSETLQSIWGSTAVWYIDGVWDPPIALIEAATAAGPTLPTFAPASSTSQLSTMTVVTTPAPAQLGDMLPSSTAVPYSSATSPSHSQGYLGNAPSSPTDQPSVPQRPSAATVPAEAPTNAIATSLVLDKYTIAATWIPGQPGSDSGNNAMIIFGSETLSVGGPAQTNAGYVASVVSPGVLIVHDDDTTTSVSFVSGAATQLSGTGDSSQPAISSMKSTLSSATGRTSVVPVASTTATGAAASAPSTLSWSPLAAALFFMLAPSMIS